MLGLSCLPSQAAVVSHYSFDSDFTDGSGNGNNATLTDVGTLGNSGIISTAGNFVFGGGAMDFSDERDYLAIPSRTFGTGTAYTVSFWAQVDDASRQWNMVTGRRGDTIFFIAPNGSSDNLRWRSNTGATGTRQVDAETGVNDTAWHHYVVTVDTFKNLSVYLDGGLVSTTANVETGFITDTIGAAYTAGGALDFRGRIDEFWLLDEAADQAMVTNLFSFNSLTPIPEPSTAMLGVVGLLFVVRRKRFN